MMRDHAELVTDSTGTAVFPRVVRWRPGLYWLLRPVPIILNVHGSWGHRQGTVRVRHLAVETFSPGDGNHCWDSTCTDSAIESQLQVTDHSEPSTRSNLEANRAKFEAFAEDWANDSSTTFLGRYRPEEYRWGAWMIDERQGWFVVSAPISHEPTKVGTFDEAARVIGTDPGSLRRWFDRAEQLKIYAIKKMDAPEGVEIRLYPGAHGLRYAPRGNDKSYAGLFAMVPGEPSNIGEVMKPFSGRWFYFADQVPGKRSRF